MRFASCFHLPLLLLGVNVLGAQTDSSKTSVDTTRTPGPDRIPWVTRRDGIHLAIAAVATLAIAPLDHPVQHELSEADWRDSRPVQHTAKAVAFFGGDGPFLASGAIYALGSIEGTGEPIGTLSGAALHNIESIALATVVTGVAKGLTGRALPDVSARHAFSFGRGFHDGNGPFVSFPSGHTAAAFAMAATLSGEVRRVDSSLARIVTPLVYAGAASVGVARVVQRQHWPSDLPLAAVIGTWSGDVVQAHAHHHGTAASALRGFSVVPEKGGQALIAWSSLAAQR